MCWHRRFIYHRDVGRVVFRKKNQKKNQPRHPNHVSIHGNRPFPSYCITLPASTISTQTDQSHMTICPDQITPRCLTPTTFTPTQDTHLIILPTITYAVINNNIPFIYAPSGSIDCIENHPTLTHLTINPDWCDYTYNHLAKLVWTPIHVYHNPSALPTLPFDCHNIAPTPG